jgi:hypothetical protein
MLFSSHCREALHFDERHAFGEIGGLMLSLIQEPGNEDVPFTFVLLGGNDGDFPRERFELAKIAGEIAVPSRAVGNYNWADQPLRQRWDSVWILA